MWGHYFFISWGLRILWIREHWSNLFFWLVECETCPSAFSAILIINSWPKGTGGIGNLEKFHGLLGGSVFSCCLLWARSYFSTAPSFVPSDSSKWNERKRQGKSVCSWIVIFPAVSHVLGGASGLSKLYMGYISFHISEPMVWGWFQGGPPLFLKG